MNEQPEVSPVIEPLDAGAIGRPLDAPWRPPPGWPRVTARILLGTIAAIAVFIALAWARGRRLNLYFGEGRMGTWLSFGLLVAAAVVCFVLRKRQLQRRGPLATFWTLLGVLLAYAAVDDVMEIHEHLDHAINYLLGWNHLGRWTDKIDDAIVAVYGLIAIGAACYHRASLLRLRWTVLMFALAFVCFAGMVTFDVLRGLSTLEDSLKLLAEALILCGVLAADPPDPDAGESKAIA